MQTNLKFYFWNIYIHLISPHEVDIDYIVSILKLQIFTFKSMCEIPSYYYVLQTQYIEIL
jgi:hypothetical protein